MPANYTRGTPTRAQLRQGLGYVPQQPIAPTSPIQFTGSTGDLDGTISEADKLTTARNIAITGDLVWNVNFDGSANVTATGTLANTAVAAGTYGDATNVAQVVVDAKGRLTGAANVPITFPPVGVPSVTFGTGAPGGTPADGALYFDDTGSPYVGYVGRAGVWQQF